jgi:hypothetical protein
VFKGVFSRAFAHPSQRYSTLQNTIERTALSVKIDIYRLIKEVFSPLGTARTAKSPKTRKLYRALVRKALEERSSPAQILLATQPSLPIAIPILGSLAVTTDVDTDTSEYLVDIETPSPHDNPETAMYNAYNVPPKLGFRIWDVNSKAKLTERGFVGEVFGKIWRGPVIAPPNPT